MPVTVMIAPAAAGKTQHCLARLRQALAERPLAPAWLVLPDPWHIQAATRRLAAQGGAIGGRIANFRDLYREILEHSGRMLPLVPEAALHRLVASEVEKARSAGLLPYYEAISQTPGFILVLREHFAEFKRALVVPEELETVAAQAGPALQEISTLYAAYQSQLHAYQWADLEGLGWLAVEALEADPQLATDWTFLAVDGFNDFTGVQLRFLGLLARRVPETLVTLPGVPGSDRPALARFERASTRLEQALGVETYTPGGQPHLPGNLARLEANLFSPPGEDPPAPPSGGSPGAVELLEVSSPEAEAREALRWIKARLLRDGLVPGDCAVLVPVLDRYRQPLQVVADEFGLALRFTQGPRLSTAPPVAAMLQLLEVARQNFARRLVLEALRNPYFAWNTYGLTPEDADVLDLVSHHGQVIAGWEQWVEVLAKLAAMPEPEPLDLDEDGPGPRLPHGADAARLQNALGCWAAQLAPSEGQLLVSEWVSWLEELLAALRYYEHGVGEADQQAFEALRAVLLGLSLSAIIAGESRFDYAAFCGELQGALEAAGFEPQSSQMGGANRTEVLVGRLIEVRSLRFRAVAILGLAEGVVPEVERPDPFAPEEVRDALRLEPRLGRGQAGLFYQAVTRADGYLLLTRPYLSADGEAWVASPYWAAVDQALGAPQVRRVRPDDPRPLAEAASTQELLFWSVQRAARQGALDGPDEPGLADRWAQLMQARQVLYERISHLAPSRYDGDLADLAAELQVQFGPEHTWSASRLEAYLACPHRFWASSLLGLETRQPPELGFDAATLGNMLHEILERAYQATSDPADPQAVLAGLPEIAAQVFSQAPERFGFRPSQLWEVEQAQFYAALQQTILQLAETEPGWEPIAYEQPFGLRGRPALQFDSAAGPVRLHGLIDRLDTNPAGEVRVLDYKTGGSHLSKNDLINGQRLQLPLYALAAWRALDMGEPVDGLYWQILAGKPGSLRLGKFEYADYAGVAGAIQLAIEHVGRAIAGVQSGAFTPQPPVGGCPDYCPAAAWCWHYQPGF